MYNVDYNTIKALNITQANTNWPKMPCQKGWSYDRMEVPYESIAMEYNWVCDKLQLGTYSVIIFFVGSIVGCFCFGYIADHYGRIPALMLANLCGLIGGVLSAFCSTFYTFSASRFVVGLAIDTCFTPMYILILENVGVEYRTLIANVAVTLYYTPSACLLPWIAYFLDNWRILSLVTSIPIVFALVLYFFLPESPRWLLSVGKIDEGMRNIQQAAEINGAKIPAGILSDFHRCSELFFNTEQSSKNYTILDLFKYPRMRRITIILILIGMIVTLSYDAHVRLIVDIGSDVFVTFSVANLTELPSGLITYFLIDRVGRKPILFMVLMLCGFGCLIAAFLTKKLSVTIAAVFSRFFANMAYNISLQWQAEVLPTVVRAQGVSLIHILSAAATLFSPLVCYLDRYREHLPLFILSVLSVICGFLVLFLPETKNAVMPQTVEDGEELWNQKFWCSA
ncbi:beta-alanine transporter [Drosophila tropicalis]|uniref:beta-alanine transporter n=1 Tax=Drosophila tropicalis TaxID=46794 RepID=UPI0035ABF55D